MIGPVDADELQGLLVTLEQPSALVELGVMVLCLTLAWLGVRALRGEQVEDGSIWFGRRIHDGVLFPLLCLALVFAAQLLLMGTITPALLRLAIPVLMALVLIRTTVQVLRASFPESHWMRLIERSFSWLVWLAAALWVTGALPLVLDAMDGISWTMGNHEVTLRRLVQGLLTAGVVMVLALWAASGIEKKLLRRTGADLSIEKLVANLVRALLLFIGLLFALSALGIDLTALGVLGGAIGVGLGFGLQKIAANYISGFVILAERSLRIGDTVKIDSFEGRITDIRTRYTLIRARDGREAIVPNEMLITQRVENSSLVDQRITAGVQVAYGTDLRSLLPQIEHAVAQVARVVDSPAPAVRLMSFAPDGLDLAVHFWIVDPENGIDGVRSDVNFAVLQVLNDNGVEIPYPQRVVHLAPAVAAPPAAATPPSGE
jgi:small-conductance mechanosensitive channel